MERSVELVEPEVFSAVVATRQVRLIARFRFRYSTVFFRAGKLNIPGNEILIYPHFAATFPVSWHCRRSARESNSTDDAVQLTVRLLDSGICIQIAVPASKRDGSVARRTGSVVFVVPSPSLQVNPNGRAFFSLSLFNSFFSRVEIKCSYRREYVNPSSVNSPSFLMLSSIGERIEFNRWRGTINRAKCIGIQIAVFSRQRGGSDRWLVEPEAGFWRPSRSRLLALFNMQVVIKQVFRRARWRDMKFVPRSRTNVGMWL